IDRPDDWVHREILHALQKGVTLLPVVLSDTPMPDAEGLPKELERLHRFQAFRLRDETWEEDLGRLMARLTDLGFKRSSDRFIRYPFPRIRIRDLSYDEINEALSSLPGWEITTSDLPGQAPLKRSEIHKAFEFASFDDAIDFMAAASKHISLVDHHPRWENIWRTVSIWLSTWDIGHKVSKLDLELAQYFEALRPKYRLPRRRGSGNRHRTPNPTAASGD